MHIYGDIMVIVLFWVDRSYSVRRLDRGGSELVSRVPRKALTSWSGRTQHHFVNPDFENITPSLLVFRQVQRQIFAHAAMKKLGDRLAPESQEKSELWERGLFLTGQTTSPCFSGSLRAYSFPWCSAFESPSLSLFVCLHLLWVKGQRPHPHLMWDSLGFPVVNICCAIGDGVLEICTTWHFKRCPHVPCWRGDLDVLKCSMLQDFLPFTRENVQEYTINYLVEILATYSWTALFCACFIFGTFTHVELEALCLGIYLGNQLWCLLDRKCCCEVSTVEGMMGN